jgi:hypothetical protein
MVPRRRRAGQLTVTRRGGISPAEREDLAVANARRVPMYIGIGAVVAIILIILLLAFIF